MELIRGKQNSALKACLFGVEGIGKSTFASKFPDAVFIDTEGSTSHMDVIRTPNPTSWTHVLEQIKHFIRNPDALKTLVIDTADWAEKLCIEHICATKQLDSIESAGYGKGYVYLAEEFGKFLNLLDDLRGKGVHILLTAHAAMRKFEQPDELGAYDRWELKLQKKVAPMIKEWCDVLLFANYKTYVINVDGQGTSKGKNKAQGGARVMYTTHHSCWDAKNRFGLPDELPFEFAKIAHLFTDVKAQPSAPAEQKPQPQPKTQPQPPTPPPVNDTPDVPPSSPPPTQEEKPTEPWHPWIGEGPAVTEDELSGIDQRLAALMLQNNVRPAEIMYVVGLKGHMPDDMPISDYPMDYINGVMIGAWDDVFLAIQDNRKSTPLS